MERCKVCGEFRKILDERGVCVFCLRGPGGKTVEKKVKPNQEYAMGKPLRSAAIEEQ